jgi:hypothetical protein
VTGASSVSFHLPFAISFLVRQHHRQAKNEQARNGIQVAKVSIFFIELVELCLFAKYKMTPESS